MVRAGEKNDAIGQEQYDIKDHNQSGDFQTDNRGQEVKIDIGVHRGDARFPVNFSEQKQDQFGKIEGVQMDQVRFSDFAIQKSQLPRRYPEDFIESGHRLQVGFPFFKGGPEEIPGGEGFEEGKVTQQLDGVGSDTAGGSQSLEIAYQNLHGLPIFHNAYT